MYDVNGSSSPAAEPNRISRSRNTQPNVRPRRPVVYATLSNHWIKQSVLRHYRFDESVECTLFLQGVSDTYLVSTQSGQFALRVYRSNWRTREAITGELNALMHLGTKGIEVAMPVARNDGELITSIRAPEGIRSAVLFQWAAGRAPKYDDRQHALRFGGLIARLHIAADDLPVNCARPHMDLDYLFAEPLRRIRPRLSNLPLPATRLDALAERVMARLNRTAMQFGDWGFCHGDVWAQNAHVDGEHLVLFDFDFCGSGWRVFDLASYRWQARRQGCEGLAWEPFIQGYLRYRPEAASSLQFVPLFMILRQLWTIAHWIGLSAEHGVGFLPDDFLEEMVSFCEKIELDAA